MFCTLIILCKLEMCHSRAIIVNTISVCCCCCVLLMYVNTVR